METASSIVSKHLACAPVTALAFASNDVLLVGQGTRLKIFRLGARSAFERDGSSRPAFDEKLLHINRIHAFVVHGCSQRDVDAAACFDVLVLGGKEVFLVDVEVSQGHVSVRVRASWTSSDWVLAGCFLRHSEILLVTSHNTVQRLRRSLSEKHELAHAGCSDALEDFLFVSEMHCIERPLLWSACFSSTVYENERDVLIAAGTIMNEILIWRPFTSDSGPVELERRLVGHTGSVFFVTFAPGGAPDLGRRLASGSDDRDVRIWHWQDDSKESARSTILRGHTHRPWRAVWSSTGDRLATVGEDLRCLLWDATVKAGTAVALAKPLVSHRTHEGKNIWSVALSPDSTLLVTGGSDGAVRTLSATANLPFSTILASGHIAAFDVSSRHILAVTKTGEIWYSEVGKRQFRLLRQMQPVDQTIQASIALQPLDGTDAIWIAIRTGSLLYGLIPLEGGEPSVVEHDSGTIPLVLAARSINGTQCCAMFDRKRSAVSLFAAGTGSIKQVTTSLPLQTDRRPAHLCWISDSLLVLADAIASVWIYAYSADEGSLTLAGETRLQIKGTWHLCAGADTNTFRVGTGDGCWTYSVRETAEGACVTAIGVTAQHSGTVKQILKDETATSPLYLSCTNTTGTVSDSSGSILAMVHPPLSSSSSLQMIKTHSSLEFYTPTRDGLQHLSYPLPHPPILQPGLHGREIWSIDLLEFSIGTILCATSAEDNNIKISAIYSTKDGDNFETLYRWPDPDGTLQNVRWVRSGMNALSALLFVTAAKEALYVLRVTLGPEGGVDVRMAGHANPPTARKHAARVEARGDEESRVMTLYVLTLTSEQQNEPKHVLLVGYSDGSLRWWMYREDTESFTLLHRTGWHDRCVLAVRLFRVGKGAGTDGDAIFAASGATDGHIAIWRLDGKCEVPLEPLWVSKAVHQSGVNCMDVQSGENGAFYLVSGGDDNSIVFQHLRFTSDGDQVDLISHAAVAAAHSSSVKGIAFVAPGTFVSTSTDQRCTLWRHNATTQALDKFSFVMTEVADVADLAVTRRATEPAWIGVCGLGLQLLQVE